MDIGLYSSWAATIVGVHLNHWPLLIHQEWFYGCCNWAHYLESSQKPVENQICVVPLTAYWSWMTFFSPSLSCLAPAGLKSKSSPFFLSIIHGLFTATIILFRRARHRQSAKLDCVCACSFVSLCVCTRLSPIILMDADCSRYGSVCCSWREKWGEKDRKQKGTHHIVVLR